MSQTDLKTDSAKAKKAANRIISTLRTGNLTAISYAQAEEFLEIASRIPTSPLDDRKTALRIRSGILELAIRRSWRGKVIARALAEIKQVEIDFYRAEAPCKNIEQRPFLRQAAFLLLRNAHLQTRSTGNIVDAKSHLEATKLDLEGLVKLREKVVALKLGRGTSELMYQVDMTIARRYMSLQEWGNARAYLLRALSSCHQYRDEFQTTLDGTDEVEGSEFEASGPSSAASSPTEEERLEKLRLTKASTIFNLATITAFQGRVSLEEGHLEVALSHLLTAKTMLDDSDDVIMKAYCEVFIGCTTRQLGTAFQADLSNQSLQPELLLQKSLDDLYEAKHMTLFSRAKLELAQFYLGAALHRRSSTFLDKAATVLERPHPVSDDGSKISAYEESRFLAQKKLMVARIQTARASLEHFELDEFDLGSTINEALRLAKLVGRTDLEAVALVFNAERLVQIGEAEEALKECERAAMLQPKDSSDIAWILLVRTSALILQGEFEAAEMCFAAYRDTETENFFIKEKAAKIGAQLHPKGSFFISAEEPNISYKHWEPKLREFLIDRVRHDKRYPKDIDKANKIDISKAIYDKSKSEFGWAIKRAGTQKRAKRKRAPKSGRKQSN